MIRQQIDQTLEMNMNRKEFLKHLCLAVLVVFGITTLLRTMGSFGQTTSQKSATKGYGSSPYGL